MKRSDKIWAVLAIVTVIVLLIVLPTNANEPVTERAMRVHVYLDRGADNMVRADPSTGTYKPDLSTPFTGWNVSDDCLYIHCEPSPGGVETYIIPMHSIRYVEVIHSLKDEARRRLDAEHSDN